MGQCYVEPARGGATEGQQRAPVPTCDQRRKAPGSAVTLIPNRDGVLKRCVLPFTRDGIPLVPTPDAVLGPRREQPLHLGLPLREP